MSVAKALEIARGLTHATFTQAKQAALVAELEGVELAQVYLPDGSGLDASDLDGLHIGIRGEDFDRPEQVALLTRDVQADEIDQDPK